MNDKQPIKIDADGDAVFKVQLEPQELTESQKLILYLSFGMSCLIFLLVVLNVLMM
jgi:hypothetical protein